jgi:hypothetical protein
MSSDNLDRIEDIQSSIGEGWHKLVLTLNEILNEIDSDYNLFQVKEKFGTLRYYVDTDNELADKVFPKIISAFEELSGHICESCGKAGELRAGGWYRTLCDDCNK